MYLINIGLNQSFKIFLNFILGPLLFGWLSYSIYRQLKNEVDLAQSWAIILASFNGVHALKIFVVLLLMPVNWGIEAKKWQLLVSGLQQVSYVTACMAVFSGQAVAFNTLNRVGELTTRSVFMGEDNRVRAIVVSFVGSMGQLIVTIGMGLLALLYVRIEIVEHKAVGDFSPALMNVLMIVIGIIWLLFVWLYYHLSWGTRLLKRIPFIAGHQFFLAKMEDLPTKELTGILFLSAIRYAVYLLQYVLLLNVFDMSINWLDASCMVGVMFLLLTLIPSIAFAELGIRGKLSILLLGSISKNLVGIVATAVGIWLINLVIPAIAGTVLLLRVKLFANK